MIFGKHMIQYNDQKGSRSTRWSQLEAVLHMELWTPLPIASHERMRCDTRLLFLGLLDVWIDVFAWWKTLKGQTWCMLVARDDCCSVVHQPRVLKLVKNVNRILMVQSQHYLPRSKNFSHMHILFVSTLFLELTRWVDASIAAGNHNMHVPDMFKVQKHAAFLVHSLCW